MLQRQHWHRACKQERILGLEPKLNPDVVGGLYAPSGGIIEPYRFVFALVESAKKNGVAVKTSFKVEKADNRNGLYEMHSSSGDSVKARYVVNAAGLFADEVSRIFDAEEFTITPRRKDPHGQERKGLHQRVVFPVPQKYQKDARNSYCGRNNNGRADSCGMLTRKILEPQARTLKKYSILQEGLFLCRSRT